ncbi:transcriptional regulator [Mesorhizobium sp. L-8-10]|uniref:IclR family transcriptional regulator n=1 Tax=unclassified Mesorhizobium TaxID=325217 RepID=UPI0019292074|nr:MULTISPECIES: IclR family transcriptional regulator [unclassified Mesorhizobium]BCH24784.1 transcriptional regulator [Mesorhizobium sp. L-8-3]BCH32522.1 transcriptional regulator [Mesorhizobium sp. L-8-10]
MRVRQIDKVLDLFEVYAREKTSLTLTALSKALGIPKSSTFNVIETLVARGFLYETKPRGGYYPTARLLDLSRSMMEGDPLVQRVHGELAALAAVTGETAVLSVRDQLDVVYVDVVESTAPIRYFAKVGERRAIHTTSSGKAILTAYDTKEREDILRSLSYAPIQPATKMNAGELAEDLDRSIERGWCEDRSESTPDVMGLGVPIRSGDRRFGLALAGPLYRMQGNLDTLVGHLLAAAERVENLIRS